MGTGPAISLRVSRGITARLRDCLPASEIFQFVLTELQEQLELDRGLFFQRLLPQRRAICTVNVAKRPLSVCSPLLLEQNGWDEIGQVFGSSFQICAQTRRRVEGGNEISRTVARAPADSSVLGTYTALCHQLGSQADLLVPILNEGQLWGVLNLHDCSYPRLWSRETKTALRSLEPYLQQIVQQSVQAISPSIASEGGDGFSIVNFQEGSEPVLHEDGFLPVPPRSPLTCAEAVGQEPLGQYMKKQKNEPQLRLAQLTQSLQREKAVAAIVNRIRRSLDLTSLFQTTAQEVRQLLQAERVALYQFNNDWTGRFVVDSAADGWRSLLQEQHTNPELCRDVSRCSVQQLSLTSSADASTTAAEALDFNDTYFQKSQGVGWGQGEAFRVVSDIYEAGFSDCYLRQLENIQARAYAIAAIYDGDRLWGLMAAYQNSCSRNWQAEELRFLLQISSHLGVAIQHAELLGQARQRSTLLQSELTAQLRQRADELVIETERQRAIAKVIDNIRRTLDLDTIFQTAATEVRQLLNADRVSMLQFVAGSNFSEGEFVAEDVLPGLDSAIEAQIEDQCFSQRYATHYRQGMVWSIDDVDQSKLSACYLKTLRRFQVRANLVVPLLRGDELWGLLCIHQCDRPRCWQDSEKEFVTRVAGQLGVAVQQAEFLRQSQAAKEAADLASQAKSEFLANMSHELRTPLNAILGFVQLMQRDQSLNPDHREHLDIIGQSGEHLLALINDVLEVSKIEAGQSSINKNNFDLDQLLLSLQEMLELKAESKGLELVFDSEEDVPRYIRTDEGKLRQILINLLGNAIKFTQQGKVALRLWSTHAPECNTGSQYNAERQLWFEVRDTGPGIAAEELNHLFEVFAQSESGRQCHEGTGLGLPISRKFSRLLGGELEVESQLGVGSIFRGHICVKQVAVSDVTTVSRSRSILGLAPGQPAYRILVVEDKWANRQLLVKLFEPLGFRVKAAKNGREALTLFKEWHPHLIWMDMRMPQMDGYEATCQIKVFCQSSRDVPCPKIIALTANAFEEERLAAISTGCDDFVRKPCKEEVLLEKMAEHLGLQYRYGAIAEPEDTGLSMFSYGSKKPSLRAQKTPLTAPTTHKLDASVQKVPSASDLPIALRILVAEDNLLNQKLARQMLQRLGYAPDIVGDGEAVLEALQASDYDVILMDVRMPKRDGISTTRALRLTIPASRQPYVIAMTGNSQPRQQQECLAAGMADHIAKPVTLSALKAALDSAIQYRLKQPDLQELMAESGLKEDEGRATTSPSLIQSSLMVPGNPLRSVSHPHSPTTMMNHPVFESHCLESQTPSPSESILDSKALKVLREIAGDGGEQFLEEMIQSYLKEAPQLISGLDDAVVQEHLPGVVQHAHSLKSMSAALGAQQLSEYCQQMEILAQQPEAQSQTWPILKMLQRSLHAELKDVCLALQALLPSTAIRTELE